MVNKYFELTLSESNQLKGIALMLLLIHHLFYIQNGLYDDIMVHGHGLVEEIGMISKVCVALFVFLSGYGLTKKYAIDDINLRRFYVERFAKLMPSFWLIWLLFVPIGIIFFDRTFESVYGNHIILKSIIQLIGLQDYAGFYGFNATWWFMSCIIGLYLLYPFFLMIQKGYGWWLLGGSFILMFIHIQHFTCLTLYIFPFALGIRCAKALFYPPILNVTILIGIIILTSLWRQYGVVIKGLTVDPILAFEIILLFKATNIKYHKIVMALSFIGRHSMNIFLFHTFIKRYYCENLIYFTRNPFLIFLSLLFCCLVISVGIEYLKKKLHFDKIKKSY